MLMAYVCTTQFLTGKNLNRACYCHRLGAKEVYWLPQGSKSALSPSTEKVQIKIRKAIISLFFNVCELGFPPEQKRGD
jgi:hypothetical protein